MKVRTRIFLLGGAILACFALTLVVAGRLERQRAVLLVRGIASEESAVFGRLLDLKGASLRAFVSDYTFWDEMVQFVMAPNRRWAAENIDTGLGTFGADAAWVYRTDGSLVYAANETREPSLDVLPLPPEDLAHLFARGRFIHFFAKSPKGPVEIAGATIHPTSDPQRTSTPRGYFFAARLWDAGFVTELTTLAGGPVHLQSLVDNQGVASSGSRPGIVAFSQDLRDWHGGTAFRVHVAKASPVIQEVDRVYS